MEIEDEILRRRGERSPAHERDMALIDQLRQVQPGIAVQLLTLAEPMDVAQILAGTMDAAMHQSDLDPIAWFNMMPEVRQKRAMASAATLVAALEKAGYVIAKALKEHL